MQNARLGATLARARIARASVDRSIPRGRSLTPRAYSIAEPDAFGWALAACQQWRVATDDAMPSTFLDGVKASYGVTVTVLG